MNAEHTRPDGVSDAAVAAAGKVTEALEMVERARGHLYDFHQLTGRADGTLDEAVELLRIAGANDLAELVETELIGRNVLPGRWTFQVVEEYDDGYYATFKGIERSVRDGLVHGRRHIFEAEMKERRRTVAHPAHTSEPSDL